VRGDLHTPDLIEVRMLLPVQAIGEKTLYAIAAVTARGE
jgi:hypothetical protein